MTYLFSDFAWDGPVKKTGNAEKHVEDRQP